MVIALIVAGVVIGGLISYLVLLKRQLRRLAQSVRELPETASHGSRLFVDFREPNLILLVSALNTMVTDLEQENSRSRRAEKQLQLSITGLSHDLRTPLTAIKGYVQLLQQTDDPVKRTRYLATIQQAVTRLMTMTDGFYELTRLDAQQKRVALKPLVLNEQVEAAFLEFFNQFDSRQLQVAFPPDQGPLTVLADEQLLSRVLQNIIQNVLRYGQQSVKISYDRAAGLGVLRVSNDVQPNSELAIQRVFDQFYTASSSRSNPESSGLGLYLSKQLVTTMNGKMTAELANGWFTLTVALPLVTA